MNQDDPYISLATRITAATEQCQALGLQVTAASQGKLTLMLPYSKTIVGNPDTGIIAGGALTTLMDSTCGFAVSLALDRLQIAPTLDLRIDYMRPARPFHPVYGSAEIYRITEQVVFARGVAYQEDREKPVANCVATFMRLDNPKNAPQDQHGGS